MKSLFFALAFFLPLARIPVASAQTPPASGQGLSGDQDGSDDDFAAQMNKVKSLSGQQAAAASGISGPDADCRQAVKAEGLIDPAMIGGACSAVRDSAGIAAVIECQRTLHAAGEDPATYGASCRYARDSSAAQGIAACHRTLKAAGEAPESLPTSCSRVNDSGGAEAVALCHKKLGAAGVAPEVPAIECGLAKNANDAETVAACHAKLGAAGINPDFLPMACRGVRDAGNIDAVAACHKRLADAGVDPMYRARACQGVRDAANVDAVAACQKMLADAGVDPAFHAAACQGVRDVKTAQGRAGCLSAFAAGRGMDSTQFLGFLSECKGAAKSSRAETAAAGGNPAAAAGLAAGASVSPAGKKFFYSTSCGDLETLLASLPETPDGGPFDMSGPVILVLPHAAAVGETVTAHDRRRRSLDVRVVKITGKKMRVADDSSGKTKVVTFCTAR